MLVMVKNDSSHETNPMIESFRITLSSTFLNSTLTVLDEIKG